MSYQLVIKVSIEAMDDMEARSKAFQIIKDLPKHISEKDTDIKIQEIYKNKPPRGVLIPHK